MNLEEFNIDFNRISEDSFEFNYKLDDTFFALKEHSLYDSGLLEVIVEGTRIENTVTLKYGVKGAIHASCERCLEAIDIPLEYEYLEGVKITSDKSLLEQENHIHESHPVFSIYDSLYERICMEMPGRLICENSSRKEACELPQGTVSKEETDPRWDKLKNLIK